MRARLAQTIFIVSCISLALYAWASWSAALPQYKNEALTIPTIFLYAVTLPGSLLVQLIYIGLALVTPVDRLDAGSAFLNWMFTTWVPLTVVGYLQWFLLVPRMASYWRGPNKY